LELPPNEIQQWQPLVVITGVGIVSSLNSKVEKSSIFCLRKEIKLNLQLYFKCKRKCTCRETEITKKCGSKLMPFIFLVKDGQEKKQCLDVNIRDFF
jgi:hypothetical protein